MATSTITNTLTDAIGTALEGVIVRARLVPAGSFRTADGSEIAPEVSTVTNSSGQWSLTLEEQAGISPSNSYYLISEEIPKAQGGHRTWAISVGASNQTLFAALVSPIPTPGTNTYLTQAAADARYIQSPLTYAAGAESRPNDAASGGSGTDVARANHVHDRETTYGTAATRTALTGTDLFEGLRYRETDSTDKLYEYRAATWLQRQDLFVVANAAARDALTTPYIGMRCLLADNGLRFWYDGSGWYLEGEQLIASHVLGSNAATLDSGTLPVIPNGADLRIIVEAQASTGAGRDFNIRFNGDSGANYFRNYMFSNNSTMTAGGNAGASALQFGTGGNENANRFPFAEIVVYNYLAARHKQARSLAFDPRSLTVATALTLFSGGQWASTAAITAVTCVNATDNWVTGSSLKVYARSTKG